MKDITEIRRRFVEAYMGEAAGNGSKAAKLAGYNCANDGAFTSMASELMALPEIQAAIDERVARDPRVMGREERQRLWSSIARGEGLDGKGEPPSWRDRLAALKTLGKAQGDFIERVEHKGEVVGGITYDLSFSSREEEKPAVLDYSHLSSKEQIDLFNLLAKSKDTSPAAIEMGAEDE